MSDEYAVSFSVACTALIDLLETHDEPGAEHVIVAEAARDAVDALEARIGATAELGTIARLRSKLANLPDGPVKTALATILED